MKRYEKLRGFTIIEMVVVIIILAIIAAVAIPRFVDLGTEAGQKATAGMAAALSASSAANFAKRSANSAQGVPIASCDDAANTLSQPLPSDYSISGGTINPGQAKQCTLTRNTGETSTFTGMGVA